MSSQEPVENRVPIASPAIGEAELDRVREVLESGHVAAGPEVEAFEEEFAAYCDVAAAAATSNGTTALHAALHALGIGPGDAVLTTPFSFVATANAIRLCGATPVFCDVDPRTLNLDPDRAATLARERDLDAMVVVHLYGLPADLDRFAEIAETHDLALVEDAAQAHGATYDGRPVGAIGDVGCFSFYPTKNMTTGEGGMIVTDRPAVADRARQFCDHGRTGRHEHVEVGHNFRMTDLAAALGREQLRRLPDFVDARRANAAALSAGLSGTSLDLPPTPDDRRHAFHQYTVRTPDRPGLRAALHAAGVDTAVYYPTPIHRQPAYRPPAGRYPVAERAAAEVLSVPVHPGVGEEAIDRITAAVRDAEESA